MRRFLDKWGTAIAAVACALTIVFAAVYTRQDDLKRIAAQEARAAQDQSLQDAQAEIIQRDGQDRGYAALRAARGHGRSGCGNYASSAKRGGIFGLGKPALPII